MRVGIHVTAAVFLAFGVRSATARAEVLVDFGATADEDRFETAWIDVIACPDCGRSPAGNGGWTLANTAASRTNVYYGIHGTPRQFRYGDRVVVTWYNNTNSAIPISPYLSLEDEDGIVDVAGQPRWFRMDCWKDLVVPARGRLETSLEMYDGQTGLWMSGFMTTGSFGVVNVSPRLENQAANALILEKIELRHDVDTVAPPAPTGLRPVSIGDTTVRLEWDPVVDAHDGAVEFYKIYVNGLFKATTKTRSDTLLSAITTYVDWGLTPGETYTYEVYALDGHYNQSAASQLVTVKTLPFRDNPSIVNPFTQLRYLGAFRLPNSTEATLPYANYLWGSSGARGLAFNPSGDPGGPADGFPGSLFGVAHRYGSYVSELSVPVPKISATKNPAELNRAVALQDLSDVFTYRGQIEAQIPLPIIAFLPRQAAMDQGKLFLSFAESYISSKQPSHGWCNLDLANPQTAGPWYVGPANGGPLYYDYIGFMFEIPEEWALVHTPGRRIVSGHYRPIALSGHGISMVALETPSGPSAPAAGHEIPFTRLLKYGVDGDTDTSHRMSGLNAWGDEWTAGAWLTVGNRSTIAILGLKGMGHGWYGMWDGLEMLAIPSIPTRGGHAPYATYYHKMLTFIDPAELADVVAGRKQPWEPQPYAYFDLEPFSFSAQSGAHGMAYDRANQLLYLTERAGDGGNAPLIHVWHVQATPAGVSGPTQPQGLRAAVDGTRVLLQWLASTDDTSVQGYRIYRDGLLVGIASTPSFIDTGASAGEHEYEVAAVDVDGMLGAPSAPVIVTIASAPTRTPGRPRNLRAG